MSGLERWVDEWKVLSGGEEHGRIVYGDSNQLEFILNNANRGSGAKQMLKDLFLPLGYPKSVGPGYLRFQTFDSVQALCSYLRGVLSTHAILEGLGVGTDQASALAATTQWVYRDGAGMIGGLLFAWAGASHFDLNVKRWRMFADLAVDVALTLELASPVICGGSRSCFTASVCTANVLKAMCGVAAGATRAVITQHFARASNTADVQAKEGSQETAVNLIGMIGGLWLAGFANEHASIVWLVFVGLTFLHLLANFLAVQALKLSTINEPRLACILDAFERNQDTGIPAINAQEPILFPAKIKFRIGVPLISRDTSRIDRASHHVLEQLEMAPCASIPGTKPGTIDIVLRTDATVRDILAQLFLSSCSTSRKVTAEDGVKFVDALEKQGWNVNSNLGILDLKTRFSKF